MLDPVSLVVGYVAGVLTLLAVSWGIRPTDDPAQNASLAVYECRCGQHFRGPDAETAAKAHAVETHNAPPQDREWLFLFTVTDD